TYVLSFGDFGRTYIKTQARNANFELHMSDIPDEAIRRADAIHIGGSVLTPELMKELPQFLRRAKSVKRDVKIVIDTTVDRNKDWNKAFEANEWAYAYIDVLSVSFDEAVQIAATKDIDGIMNFFISRGVKSVFLKMGELGSCASYVDEHKQEVVKFYIPALKGLKRGAPVWDETGAGDAYTTGLVYGITHGWDLRKTSMFATIMGGMACRHIGGTIENENIVDAIANMRELWNQISQGIGGNRPYPHVLERPLAEPMALISI
ncbi:MAG: PfkB family carbohydrate kinase, partial [Candidatus Omnitrophica bacterium]|nr:PfkB family carbohydrate kinase [Candidatus Omnitrophota bacterium]